MACHPPDYLSVATGDGENAKAATMSNPLLRPLDGSPISAALLQYQEPSSFRRGSRQDKMVGQVLAMCPKKEIQQKVSMNTASDLERVSSSKVNPNLAMKSFQRSDASRVFKPEETRPAMWCRRTVYNALCYFVDADIVRKPYIMEKKFSYLDVYNFLRDRLRSVWQDLTVQHCTRHRAYIECFEISIRFLIYSNEVLCENEEYDIAQNKGLLNTCLDKLMQGYEDVHKYRRAEATKANVRSYHENRPYFDDVMSVLVYDSPHEGEFWSYRLLMHIPQLLLPGGSAIFCDIWQRMPCHVKKHKLVTFASEVCHAAASGNVYRYFQLLKRQDCHALHASLMNRFSACLRVRFLETLVSKKIAKKDVNPMDIGTFKNLLGFEGENETSIDKLCKKYDVKMWDRDSATFLEFEKANAEQLAYDAAAPQKLSNKFQTSSIIVKCKLDAYDSRQKLFDPDFVYPKGTGPDTVGPPLDDLSLADLEEHENQITQTTATTFSQPVKTSSIFGFANTFSGARGISMIAKPFPISENGFGESSILNEADTSNSSSGFPGFGNPSPYQSKSFGFPLFKEKQDCKPPLFGTSSTMSRPSPFRASPMANVKDKDSSSVATSDVPKAPLFGFNANAAPSSKNLFTFGKPEGNAAGGAFPAGIVTNDGASSQKPCHSFAPEQPKEHNNFGIPKANDAGGKTNTFPSTTDNQHGDPNPLNYSFGKKETPKLFTFGPKDKSSEVFPLFKFGPVASTNESASTLGTFNSSKEPEDSTKNAKHDIFVAIPPSNQAEKPLFKTVIPTETAKAPVLQFKKPDSVNTDHQPVETQNIFSFPSNASVASNAPILETAPKENEKQSEELKPDSTFSLAYIIEKCERDKILRHVTIKRPKVSFNFKSFELDTSIAIPGSKEIFDKMKRVGTFIVESNQYTGDEESAGEKARFSVKLRGSIYSRDSFFYRPYDHRRAKKHDAAPQVGGSLLAYVGSDDGSHAMVNGEVTPRGDFKINNGGVIYLSREGSLAYLYRMYNKGRSMNNGEKMLSNLVACENCYRVSHPDALWSSLNTIKYIAASIFGCTAAVTRFAYSLVKRSINRNIASPPLDGTHSRKRARTSTKYQEVSACTARAVKYAAVSTSKIALTAGSYLFKAVRASKRLLNGVTYAGFRSLQERKSPLDVIVSETTQKMEVIIAGSEKRLLSSTNGRLKIDSYERWSEGVYWHLNFFAPLTERKEYYNRSTCGSESGRRLTSSVLAQSINDYMSSDYCVRLKQDVMHLIGLEISAEELYSGDGGYKRQMVEYRKYDVSASGSNIEKVTPVTVSISMNLNHGAHVQSPWSRSQFELNCDHSDYSFTAKKRRIFSNGNAQQREGHFKCHQGSKSIQQGDLRYNNKASVFVYALSDPVHASNQDVVYRMFSLLEPKGSPNISVNLRGIDVYGIVSSVNPASQDPGSDACTPCLVCYRIAVSYTDIMTLYEFLSEMDTSKVHFCDCTDKSFERRESLLLEFINNVERKMMDSILSQVSQFNVTMDPNVFKTYISFACVGFQLNENQRTELPEEPVGIPRLLYSDGLCRGIRDVIRASIDTQSISLCQKAFTLPNLGSFLFSLFAVSNSEHTNNAASVPRCLHDELQKVREYVKENFNMHNWDSMARRRIKVAGELTCNDECTDGTYSLESFLELLTKLKDATRTYKIEERRKGIFAVDDDELPVRMQKCIDHVLSSAIVQGYQVPYAIGLYMSNIVELARP